MSAFLTPLELELVDDLSAEGRGLWSLVIPLVYQSDIAGITITVPAGFRTDLASVPRLPLVFLAFGGRASRASVPHDWLYSTHTLDKVLADRVFLEAMLLTQMPLDIAHEMYLAVSLFGKPHWEAPITPQTPEIVSLIGEIPCVSLSLA